MADEIKTGVTLSLKDLFSQNMNKAAGAASGFAGKALGAIEKVDGAISGTAAKFAAFGLGFSIGAAAKGVIEMDHRMTRLGLSANASSEKIAELKRAVFDAAQAPDVKIDPANILSGLELIINKTSDLKYAEDNIRNIGLAIQATGESPEAIADIFSEFQKFGYTTEQISSLMDDMTAQANQGAFSLGDFAKYAAGVFSVLEAKKIGATPENIKSINAALQIINAGAKNPEKAARAFNSALEEITDPEKEKKLRRIGIKVRDDVTKEFRDFNDIMLEIAAASENPGYANYLERMFSDSSMLAVRSFISHGDRMHKNLTDLGDTTGLLQRQSAAMAGTLQSNIKNLQTAFNSFADTNLAKPLEKLTELFNTLAEDPERIKKTFAGIAVGIGAITTVKGIAGISRFVGSLLQLKNGGKIDIGGMMNTATAMPVYVTNWGGAGGGGSGIPGFGGSPPSGAAPGAGGLASLLGKASPYLALAAVSLGISKYVDKKFTEQFAIDGAHYSDWEHQARVAELSDDRERELEAQIAMLKIAIPEYEYLHTGFDPQEQFLHWGSNGEERMVTLDGLRAELQSMQEELTGLKGIAGDFFLPEYLPPEITAEAASISSQKDVDGRADINVNVNVSDDRITANSVIEKNTLRHRVNPGSSVEMRRSGL